MLIDVIIGGGDNIIEDADERKLRAISHQSVLTRQQTIGFIVVSVLMWVPLLIAAHFVTDLFDAEEQLRLQERDMKGLHPIFDSVRASFATASSHLAETTNEIERSVREMNSEKAKKQADGGDIGKVLREFNIKLHEAMREDQSLIEKTWPREVEKSLDKSPLDRGPAVNVNDYHAVGQQQQIIDFDNEYPPGPIDEIPGPAYIQPADPFADLSPDDQNTKRRRFVVDAFKHSWQGYVDFAFGMDELQPRSKTGKNWNEQPGKEFGLGLTILDSVTTMHLMGLHDELEIALDFIRNDLSFDKDVDGSAFETTIRVLGSLLSIYELTGEKDKKILAKAVDIADRIMCAYNTSSGIPHSTVNFASKRHFNPQWTGGGSVLSEFGTVQLEMRTLSYHTGNPIYDMKATHAMSIIESRAPYDMLCPVYMSVKQYQWMTDHISLGALGDSFYEYVLKQFLLTGRTEKRYEDMFERLANGIVDKLLFHSIPSKWAFVSEYRRREFFHKMDHLACFVGGMLALGAHSVPALQGEKEKLMKTAADLTDTCVKLYTRQQLGVSPELVEFPGMGDFINGAGYYILRPETFEALFYMWRFTKQQKWRDMGWNMFRAIDRWCKVPSGGYAGLREVNAKEAVKDNLMQSFWMAETLKYAFLLFANDDILDLNEWVFNTEAHPLKIRKRDPLDVWRKYENEHNGFMPWVPPPLQGVSLTETATMTMNRREKRVVYKAVADPFGEDFEDGAIEDEGMPFDTNQGVLGIPRDGVDRTKYLDMLRRQKGAAFVEKLPNPKIIEKGTGGGRRSANPPLTTDPAAKLEALRQKQRANEKEFLKQHEQEIAKKKQPPRNEQQQQPPVVTVATEGDADTHEESRPKPHKVVTKEERRAAIEKQKELRRKEKERQLKQQRRNKEEEEGK